MPNPNKGAKIKKVKSLNDKLKKGIITPKEYRESMPLATSPKVK
tara:strand:- start:6306 stop:6437 length:132 start_codon:yes stop_codon:yes gene_type:complete